MSESKGRNKEPEKITNKIEGGFGGRENQEHEDEQNLPGDLNDQKEAVGQNKRKARKPE